MDEENNGPGPKTIAGENTGKVKTKSNGEEFALVTENANGLRKGDSIMIGNTTLIKNSYIPGGDYNIKKTGNKKYKID
jgi:hypothetical protein